MILQDLHEKHNDGKKILEGSVTACFYSHTGIFTYEGFAMPAALERLTAVSWRVILITPLVLGLFCCNFSGKTSLTIRKIQVGR